MLRIFFSTDMHGSEVTFQKYIGAANFYKADIMILGGDISGKGIAPLMKKDDGQVTAQIAGKNYSAKSAAEIEKLSTLIRDMGYYGFTTSPEEWASISSDGSKMDELFIKLSTDRLRH